MSTQEIFPTQGLNLGLLHCGQTLYCLSHREVHLHSYLNLHVLPLHGSIEKLYLSLTILLHYLKLDDITDFSLNHRVPIEVNHTVSITYLYIHILF